MLRDLILPVERNVSMHVSNEGLPAILVPLGYSEKKEFIFHATNADDDYTGHGETLKRYLCICRKRPKTMTTRTRRHQPNSPSCNELRA